jgi:hypothetical protein
MPAGAIEQPVLHVLVELAPYSALRSLSYAWDMPAVQSAVLQVHHQASTSVAQPKLHYFQW